MAAPGGQRKVVMPRRFQGRISTVRAGALTILVILIVASSSPSRRHSPGSSRSSSTLCSRPANNLRLDSPVRIAGVNVGKVTKVERDEGLRPRRRSR